METTIGVRIRQLREVKRLSVADFAKAAGVKPSAIYGLESGANKPSIETVASLRHSFPCLNVDWLLLGTGPMLTTGRALPLGQPQAGPTEPTEPTEPTPPRPAAGAIQPEAVGLAHLVALAKERDALVLSRERTHREELTEVRREAKERIKSLVDGQQTMMRLMSATMEGKDRDLAFCRAEIAALRTRLYYAEGRAGMRELTAEEQQQRHGSGQATEQPTGGPRIGFHRQPSGLGRVLAFNRPPVSAGGYSLRLAA